MKVNSRLKVLIAEKELRDNQRYSLRSIARASGAALPTVVRLMNNSIKQVPLEELAKLCAWGHWQVGEILRADEVAEQV